MSKGLIRHSLVDSLAEALVDDVLTGELSPGSPVTEQDVATNYSVARPTAKAAIERVAQSGILRRAGAGRPARVPVVAEEEIEDLYYSRILLERQVVASLIARGAGLGSAQAALTNMSQALVGGDMLTMLRSDLDFHRALVEGLESERVMRMFDAVALEAQLCMAQEHRESFDRALNVAEHQAIFDAIESRDVGLARERVTSHLQAAAERLLGREVELSRWIA